MNPPTIPATTVAPTLPVPADSCEVFCVHPQAVAQARAVMPGEQQVTDATLLLKLVADPTRLKILSALRGAELCVCDLATVVGISESAASHQLRLLRTGRVVAPRREGRTVYYRLLDSHVTTLIANALEHVGEERQEGRTESLPAQPSADF